MAVTLPELLDFASRNPMLSLALVGLTLALLWNEVSGLVRGIRGVGPAQLVGMINRDNATVVDIRAPAEFEQGHISGSRNILPAQLDPAGKLLGAAKSANAPVVLVCRSGQTAQAAAATLKKAGFEQVYVLHGGIEAWRQADLPVVKGRA